ncbi:nucleotidyltransferase family protein [Streptococcus caprae]|uniref:Nucleotidyltransferase family protein n=1 Tax=Streptococcus caprae TaxID=1640501 RepID=A0ABV8CVJ5_9STRE
MTDEELKNLLLSDPDLQTIFRAVRDLGLPDCWVAAGCVRNAIWNALSGQPVFDRTTDVDVVFYDLERPYEDSSAIEQRLKETYPAYLWEVKNQAYMHQHSPNTARYSSSCEAISKYPETCTAIAARLVGEELELFAPYSLEDILHFVLRPTPHFLADEERLAVYQKRLAQKNWSEKWPQLILRTT